MLFQIFRIEPVFDEVGIAHHTSVEVNDGLDAAHFELVHGAPHLFDGAVAVFGPDDHLADHRVVVLGNDVARMGVAVDTHILAAGGDPFADLARARHEVHRVLGRDAALDGVALEPHVALIEKGVPLGDADHPFDDVDAADHLADAVLHLQAGVHLHEVEVFVLVHEKLEGSRTLVPDVLRRLDRRFVKPGAGLVVEEHRRRLFDQLLVAALHRAVPLADMHGVAVGVGQHLHLDMARVFDELLHVDRAVAEGRDRFALGGEVGVFDVALVLDDAHAASSTARRGFEDDRKAHLFGQFPRLLDILDGAVAAGYDGHARLFHHLFGFALVAHQRHDVDARTDEFDAVVFADLDEILVFAQKPVPRKDSVAFAHLRRRDDGGDVEVAFGAFWAADADAGVGQAQVAGLFVGRGVDGDRLLAHLFDRADRPQGYLTPVGDQYAFDFGHRLRPSRPGRAACRTRRAGRLRPGCRGSCSRTPLRSRS